LRGLAVAAAGTDSLVEGLARNVMALFSFEEERGRKGQP